MTLSPGTRVGPYEVIGTLGAGGMGEVYRARDNRLGRDVALKVLPTAFSTDPERLGRFQREAQVLAALNHPHIAQIYGLEDSPSGAGQYERALVMELVEGPTLADLIVRGAVDTSEALRIAKQIALALEAAHDRGITHRDLKPSNVKVSADGSVKVLDFGLAKLSPVADSSVQRSAIELSASPTLTSPALATGLGIILGTAAYMSPEQARGRPVDKRADIWAFGCVLYEMLTGRRAFDGDDVSDTLAGVLRGEPDWALIPAGVSSTLRQYLRRCLTKDPSQRIHDIADMRLAIDGAFDVPMEAASAGPLPATAAAHRRKRMLALGGTIAAVAVAAAALGGAAARVLGRDKPPAVIRLVVTPPDGTSLSPSQGDADVAVSPDGSRMAFVNIEQGSLRLYVRTLDQLNAVRLEAVGSPRFPFFSPDGAWIGFFEANALKRISANGGPPVSITAVTGIGRGATWGADGTIIFATSDSTGLMRVSATGGEPTVLTTPGQGEDHILPEFLPGGKAVLFSIRPEGRTTSSTQIGLLNLESGAVTTLLPSASHATYASSGHLVYGSEGSLRAVSFDLDTFSVRGNPVRVVERVVTKATGAANFALASNGLLVYESGDPTISADRSLVWVDREGHEEALPAPRRSYVYPRISPDGTRIALDIRDQQNDIWIYHLARQTLSRLTFDPGLNRGIAWTPDGQRVAFSAEREGKESVFWQAADGSGSAEPLTSTTPDKPQAPYSFSSDGKMVLFAQPGQPPFDLYTVETNSSRKIAPLLNSSYSENNGEISPDGRWLAYQSDESGSNEIYVRPFPNVAAGRSQVSSGGGTRPVWARSGRELFYSSVDGAMMSVSIDSSVDSGFLAGNPKALFAGVYYSVQAGRSYDVSADGRRFLMIKNITPRAQSAPQLVVVLNWTEELKRLVPRE
jgi:Tol biopolymer transport system component